MTKKIILSVFVLIVTFVATYIVYTWNETEKRNADIQQQILKSQEVVKAEPPPVKKTEKVTVIQPPRVHAVEKDSDGESRPKAKPVSEPPIVVKETIIDDSERKKFLQEQQIHLELVGVLKLQLNPNNSWETIFQLLVLLLFSYGGVKAINKKFA